MHSTNYENAFIEVADDCKAATGTIPPEKAEKTVARLQYEMIRGNPYRYTSDEILFAIHAERTGIRQAERDGKRAEFFSKGQACLRTSPLAKSYGWGIHHDAQAKVAIYACESPEYEALRRDPRLTHVKAMRSAR